MTSPQRIVKILLDMNIPEVWVAFLNKAGHDATHWSRVGDIHARDTEIMAWARAHQHVVFTHDLDFGSLLFGNCSIFAGNGLGRHCLGTLSCLADEIG